jgi:hypothetical protein
MTETKKKESPADRMRIRTNPAFDKTVEPQEQEWAYVNPVALNNDLITIGNEMISLAEVMVACIKENQRYRLDKKKLQREQDSLETRLLSEDQLNPSEGKNLKTTAAAIAKRIKDHQFTTIVSNRMANIEHLEDLIEKNEEIIKTAKIYWDSAERLSDNIKTHLSWKKDEKKRGF